MFSSHTRSVYLLALLAACCPGATAAEVDRPISVYIMTDMEGVAGLLDFEPGLTTGQENTLEEWLYRTAVGKFLSVLVCNRERTMT